MCLYHIAIEEETAVKRWNGGGHTMKKKIIENQKKRVRINERMNKKNAPHDNKNKKKTKKKQKNKKTKKTKKNKKHLSCFFFRIDTLSFCLSFCLPSFFPLLIPPPGFPHVILHPLFPFFFRPPPAKPLQDSGSEMACSEVRFPRMVVRPEWLHTAPIT